MPEPGTFCRAMLREYERQWGRATGHGVRHPLRLKMDRLQVWCTEPMTAADFEVRLITAQASEDVGVALLADELLPLWRATLEGQPRNA